MNTLSAKKFTSVCNDSVNSPPLTSVRLHIMSIKKIKETFEDELELLAAYS